MSRFLISRTIIPIAVFLLTACGPKQSTIRLTETPKIHTSSTKNITVHIINITDSREFVPSNDNPTLPQLATVKDIGPVIASTATAQLRNVLGNVLLDIFTEKKITDIVKSAIEESFERAGYNVSNSATNAIPIDVNITRFWSYNTGGIWMFHFHFDISVEITGNLSVLKEQQRYSSNIKLASAFGASPRSFNNTISKGMDKFIRDLATKLEKDFNDDSVEEYYSPHEQKYPKEKKGLIDSFDAGDEYYSPEK